MRCDGSGTSSDRSSAGPPSRGGVVTVIMLAIIYAGVVHHINPPSNIETVDPKTLHLTGEFTEGNLGTQRRRRRAR